MLPAAAALLGALGLTLAVELPLGALLFCRPRELCLRAVVTVLLMNIATNPTLNLALLLAGTVHRTVFVVLGEAAVVAVEMLVLRRALGVAHGRAFLSSLLLNTASFTVGLATAGMI